MSSLFSFMSNCYCPICTRNITDNFILKPNQEQQIFFCEYHKKNNFICKKCVVCTKNFYKKRSTYKTDTRMNNNSIINSIHDSLVFSEEHKMEKQLYIVQNEDLCDGCISVRREIKDDIYMGIYTYPHSSRYKIQYRVSVYNEDTCIETSLTIKESPKIILYRLEGLREVNHDNIHTLSIDMNFMKNVIKHLYNYSIYPKERTQIYTQMNTRLPITRIEFNVERIYNIQDESCILFMCDLNNIGHCGENRGENNENIDNTDNDVPH